MEVLTSHAHTTSKALAIVLLVVLLIGAGCGAYMYSFQSSFFSKFSLRELVDRSESRAGLDDAVTGTLKVSATKGPIRFYTLKADLKEKSK